MSKIADFIARKLEEKGVSHVFELVGGMSAILLDAIHANTKIKIVSLHHEQAVAFAVDGWSRMAGKPAVALVTSGPGATNLITGIASCYFDSVPAIFITGQVNRHELRKNQNQRQFGFQETEITKIVESITKKTWLIKDEKDIKLIIEDAFRISTNGRPGPVLIDIPMDVQRAELPNYFNEKRKSLNFNDQTDSSIKEFVGNFTEELELSSKPLILAGGGINSSNSIEIFRDFVNKVKIPVVSSLMCVDALPYKHPMRVGMIGTYGNRWANLALKESDLIIVIGSRLDVRQIGVDIEGFSKNKTIFQVDCDENEINSRLKANYTINCQLKDFLTISLGEIPSASNKFHDWELRIKSQRNRYPDTEELNVAPNVNPNVFMHKLSNYSHDVTAYVVDVGQHQMWAAQSLELGHRQKFITSGGMGAMGFALPAAIGASFATNGIVVVLTGDGGIQLNIQELQTIKQYDLPIKIFVINNNCQGMIRQFQETYFKDRYFSSIEGYTAPNFSDVAIAYGIGSSRLDSHEEMDTSISAAFHSSKSPYLLDVGIDQDLNVYPKMAFGKEFGSMEPDVLPDQMEGT